jgi:hypothetical protein
MKSLSLIFLLVAWATSASAQAASDSEKALHEQRWLIGCKPVVAPDKYGVQRYHYAAEGCEFTNVPPLTLEQEAQATENAKAAEAQAIAQARAPSIPSAQPPAAQASLSPQAQFCLGELGRVNNITRNVSNISSASHALAGMRAIYAECRAFPKFEEEISASIERMSRGLDALVKTCMENPSMVEQCRWQGPMEN